MYKRLCALTTATFFIASVLSTTPIMPLQHVYADENYIVNDDFTDTTAFPDGPLESNSGWAAWNGNGDPSNKYYINGGKLVIEHPAAAPQYVLHRLFEPVSDGKLAVEIEFSRDDSDAGNSVSFPALTNNGGNKRVIHRIGGDSRIYISHSGGTQLDPGVTVEKGIGHRYRHTFIVDLDEHKYDFQHEILLGSVTAPALYTDRGTSSDTTPINTVEFNFPTETKIYIYKLKVYRPVYLGLESFTMSDGSAIPAANSGDTLPIRPEFKLTFSDNIEDSASNLSNGITISPAITMVTAIDEKVVTLSFPNGLDYDTSYEITVTTALESVSGLKLSSNATQSFKTEEQPEHLVTVESIRFTDFDGKTLTSVAANNKVCVEATIESIEIGGTERNIFVVLTFENSESTIKDIMILNTTIGSYERQILTAGFTVSAEPGMSCKAYVWDNMPGGPYHAKTILVN